MVYRDPETGLFKSGNGGDMEYRDYEFKHVHSQYTLDASEVPAAFPLAEEDIREVSLDDVLDREERADLVAVKINSLQASVPGTSSAESLLKARFELRAGVGSELIMVGDSDYTENAGSSGVVDTEFWDSDSPDVLYHAAWEAEAGFSDTTTGVAAGPMAQVISDDVHFPREFGSCPQFDDRDEITESIWLDGAASADISDSNVRLQVDYTLVFSVHDRD